MKFGTLMICLALVLVGSPFLACQTGGEGESAVDKAAETVSEAASSAGHAAGEAVGDAVEAAGEGMEKAGDAMKEGAEKVGGAMKDAGDATKKEAGEKIDEGAAAAKKAVGGH